MAKLISLENLTRFKENVIATIWAVIAQVADGTTITYDAESRKLSAAGGGSSSGGIIAYAGNGELEDLTVKTGSFLNAGEGWNTFTFAEPFDGIPHIMATAEDGYTVTVKGVTEAEFLYKVATGESTVSATTGNYYVFTSKSTSSSYLTQIPIVTAISASGGAGTADPVTIWYTALEYGGE